MQNADVSKITRIAATAFFISFLYFKPVPPGLTLLRDRRIDLPAKAPQILAVHRAFHKRGAGEVLTKNGERMTAGSALAHP
jgi:hypothetical protein